ncbi:hypothetical protein SAMN05444407_10977 [Chryseobacterium contaminans]|uniref:Uncharacterized protein n=1 Tax=Chryseobacterium contaminans TaxID=1423959 RepID=A0A1M7FWZ8_9FLAO|nr:hypothetical protein SAMN05444407_10977 [Chryseobacterium contaminans]
MFCLNTNGTNGFTNDTNGNVKKNAISDYVDLKMFLLL